jgi:hypothetical protein
MTALVHRRRLRPVAPEPKGPGGTIGPIFVRYTWPLTWVGWLSILAAGAFLLWQLPQQLGYRFSDESDTFDVTRWLGLLPTFGDAALILLPAALELGYPNVARRNRWLRAGTALIALQQVGSAATGPLFGWLVDAGIAIDPSADGDPTVGLQVMFLAVGVGLGVVAVAGWLAFARGLWRAGARPTPRVLMAVVAAIAVPQVVELAIVAVPAAWASLSVIFGVRLLLGVVEIAASAAVATAFLWGAKERRAPRRAWRIGAIAAVMFAISYAFGLVVVWAQRSEFAPLAFTSLLGLGATWPLLLMVSCLAGLGRGTEARPSRSRRRRFVVKGERQMRGEGWATAVSDWSGAQPSESR